MNNSVLWTEGKRWLVRGVYFGVCSILTWCGVNWSESKSMNESEVLSSISNDDGLLFIVDDVINCGLYDGVDCLLLGFRLIETGDKGWWFTKICGDDVDELITIGRVKNDFGLDGDLLGLDDILKTLFGLSENLLLMGNNLGEFKNTSSCEGSKSS